MTEFAKLAELTGPAAGWRFGDLRADPLLFFVEPYRALGPVFRMQLDGTDAAVMAGVESNEFAWSHSEFWDCPAVMTPFSREFGPRYLTAMEGEAHQTKRRRMLQGFKARVLADHAQAMYRASLQVPEAAEGSACELRDLCNRVVFRQSNVLLGADVPEGLADDFILFERLLLGSVLGPEQDGLRERIFPTLENVVDAKLTVPDPGSDLFARIIAAHDPKREPLVDRQEWIHDLALLYLAGTETVAHIILWALLFLARGPGWLAELRAEVDELDTRDLTALQSARRLRATVLETERLRPPIPIFYRMPKNDFRLCGAQVPAYTLCVHPIALAHFLEEVYPDPLSFLPRRHLQRTWSRSVIGTFGGGTHLCLGHNLAHLQTPLALAALLKNYEYELGGTPSLDYVLDPVTTPIEKSIPIQLRRRRLPRRQLEKRQSWKVR